MKQNLLLRATTTLNKSEPNDNEIITLYKELKNVNKRTLKMYYNQQTVKTHENDLDLYLEVIKKLYKIIENNDKYHVVIK